MAKRNKGYIKTRRRQGLKSRLFARDYAEREGRWGSFDDPYYDLREEGRDRWIRCYYCGEYVKVAHADIAHIVAHCQGGTEAISNLVLAHSRCNNLEGRRYNETGGEVHHATNDS